MGAVKASAVIGRFLETAAQCTVFIRELLCRLAGSSGEGALKALGRIEGYVTLEQFNEKSD